jgi:translation initiation factor 2B subunit (eIF-2B alpha/beta/delta family)
LKEKRTAIEPRREEDRILYSQLCPEHKYIQDSTKEHRQIVCKKIEKVEVIAERAIDTLKSKVDWKVLLLLVGILLAAIGFFWDSMVKGQTEIKSAIGKNQDQLNETVLNIHRRISETNDKRISSMEKIATSINNIEDAQIKMEKRLDAVEQNLKTGFAAGAKANPK